MAGRRIMQGRVLERKGEKWGIGCRAPNQNQARVHRFLVLRAKTPPLLDLFISASQHFNHQISPFPQTSSIGPLAICMHKTKIEPMHIGFWFCRPKPPPLLDHFISTPQHFNHRISSFPQTSSIGPLAICMHKTKTEPAHIGFWFCRPKPRLCSIFSSRPPSTSTTISYPSHRHSPSAPLPFACTRLQPSLHTSVFGLQAKTPASTRSFHLNPPALQSPYLTLPTDILHGPPCCLRAPDQNRARTHQFLVLQAKTSAPARTFNSGPTILQQHRSWHHIDPPSRIPASVYDLSSIRSSRLIIPFQRGKLPPLLALSTPAPRYFNSIVISTLHVLPTHTGFHL